MTKLNRFCDRLLEAGWLMVAATLPMYFDILGNNVFELDKIVVLRVVVVVMALAQFVKWAEDRPARRQVVNDEGLKVRNPLTLPALALAATILISTAFSITPRVSMWGSYERLQGTYTLLSCVALFFMMAANLRHRAQLNRLTAVLLLTSAPVSVYGLAQYIHLDPVPWRGGTDVAKRVVSSMGNAIFLAAYLIMVVPFTLHRLIAGVLRLRDYQRTPGCKLLQGAQQVFGLGGILAAELLLLALCAFMSTRNPNVWWVVLPLSGLSAVLAVLFVIPKQTYFASLMEVMGCSLLLALQLVTLFLTGSRGPWIGMVVGMIGFAIAIRHGRRRLLAGVGAAAIVGAVLLLLSNLPGTPWTPLRQVPYLASLGSLLENRADTVRVRMLIWQGTVDLLMRRPPVGLAESDPLGVARPVVGYGPESMFVAFNKAYVPELAHYEARNASPDRNHNDLLDYLLTTGMLGLAAYCLLLVMSFRLLWRHLRQAHDLPTQGALAAILAALIAHIVESMSGVVISVTRAYFWIYLAALASGIIWQSPLHRPPPAAPTSEDQSARAKPAIILFALVLAAATGWYSSRELGDAEIATYLSFAGLIGGMLVLAISIGGRSPGIFCRPRRIFVYALATIAALAVVVSNINVVIADVYAKQGYLWDSVGQFDKSVAQYQEAVRLAGDQDRYLLLLGRGYLEMAKTSKGDSAMQLLSASLYALEQARDLNPLNTDHYVNLARLYVLWGVSDSTKLELANEYYRQATILSPRTAHLYNEWAQLHLARGDLGGALEKALQAKRIDARFAATHVLLGDVYALLGRPSDALEAHRQALSIDPASLSEGRFEERLAAYESWGMLVQVEQLYAKAAQDFHDSVALRAAYGYLLLRQNKLSEAVAQFEASARLAPTDWTTHRNLAYAYKSVGMIDQARSSARAALAIVPPTDLEALRTQLGELGDE